MKTKSMKTKSMKEVVQAMLGLCGCFGFPEVIQSDRGPEFNNRLPKALVEKTEGELRLSSPYHPEANGIVERSNGTWVRMRTKMVPSNPQMWPRHLPVVQLYLNNTVRKTHASRPFALMFGRLPHGVQLGEASSSAGRVTARWPKLSHEIWAAVEEGVGVRQPQRGTPLGRKLVTMESLPRGTVVVVKKPFVAKLELPSKGPFRVLKSANNSYTLEDFAGNLPSQTVPKRALKVTKLPDREAVFDVEGIRNHRRPPTGEMECLGKRANYPGRRPRGSQRLSSWTRSASVATGEREQPGGEGDVGVWAEPPQASDPMCPNGVYDGQCPRCHKQRPQ